jgi:hypothetical protein
VAHLFPLFCLKYFHSGTEEIREKYQKILGFYQLMEEFGINKNKKTADGILVKGIAEAFSSLRATAGTCDSTCVFPYFNA